MTETLAKLLGSLRFPTAIQIAFPRETEGYLDLLISTTLSGSMIPSPRQSINCDDIALVQRRRIMMVLTENATKTPFSCH